VNDIAYTVVRQRKQEFRESQQNGTLRDGSDGTKGARYDIISLYLERHDEESRTILVLSTLTLSQRMESSLTMS
jgi:hypothetical protein